MVSLDSNSEKEHDCSKCEKIPAAITVIQSEDKKEYSGELNLNQAIFGYKLKITGEKMPANLEEAMNSIDVRFTNLDGKEMRVNLVFGNYMKELVIGGAASLAVQSERAGIGNLQGMLEQMLGSKMPAPLVTASYRSCQPATPEIRQYIEDYKLLGGKA